MASERQMDLGEPGAGLLDGSAWAPLPEPLTSFVGRAREREAVAGLLRPGGIRLLTLTGPGGVGKTRLALRVAQEIGAGYEDGVVFVPLAAIDDPAVVMMAVAQAFGVRVGGEGAPVGRLQAALRRANVLLVLDNMEQVLGAGSEVAALLGVCPGVTVLVTSRVPLHVSGEHEFAVSPLSLNREMRDVNGGYVDFSHTSPITTHDSDAVELFVQRARAVRPEFALQAESAVAVAEVCRRLDGLPLAIELAAARSKVLAPAALLARLEHGLEILSGGPRDQPARLQTLRAAIAWSYDLLAPEERDLLRRLAVFAGGFTLEAAEAVGSPGGEGEGEENGPSASPPRGESPVPLTGRSPTVLDLVAALVDSSLLRSDDGGNGEPRCAMLETVRVFALEQLDRSGEERSVRERHAASFLALAEAAAPALYGGPEQARWRKRLETEHDNLRSALRWAAGEAGETGLRLAGALAWFWYVRGHLREGHDWLERVLARHDGAPTPARLRALLGLGLLVHRLGDDARAIAALDEALILARDLGDSFSEGLGQGLRGIVAEDRGDYAGAAPYFDRCLALIPPDPAMPHAPVSALALVHRGVVAWGQGDTDGAIDAWNAAMELHRSLGNDWGVAIVRGHLGLVAVERGDYAEGARLQRESLDAFWEAGAQEEVVWLLNGIAVHLARRGEGNGVGAARIFGAAEALQEAVGSTLRYPERALFERTTDSLRTGPDAIRVEAAWAEGGALSPAAAVAEALVALDGLVSADEPRTAPGVLSPRELDVMRLLVTGKTDREIADALFISRRTAQGHVANIFAKLGVSTRTAAATVALQTKLLQGIADPSDQV